jgi:chaperonin GroES
MTVPNPNPLVLQMVHDLVAILPDPEQEVSSGGTVLVGAKVDRVALKGTVVGVGPGKRYFRNWKERISMSVRVGDRVLFSEYEGNVSAIDGVKYVILRDDDLLAVLPPLQ